MDTVSVKKTFRFKMQTGHDQRSKSRSTHTLNCRFLNRIFLNVLEGRDIRAAKLPHRGSELRVTVFNIRVCILEHSIYNFMTEDIE